MRLELFCLPERVCLKCSCRSGSEGRQVLCLWKGHKRFRFVALLEQKTRRSGEMDTCAHRTKTVASLSRHPVVDDVGEDVTNLWMRSVLARRGQKCSYQRWVSGSRPLRVRQNSLASFCRRLRLVQSIAEQEAFTGRFRAADATKEGKNQIKLLLEHSGKIQTIIVPSGMMADIVRPMWDEIVLVRARRKRGILKLVAIEKVRGKAGTIKKL